MAKNNEHDSNMPVYEETTVANGNLANDLNKFNRQTSNQSNTQSNPLQEGED
jgi:hypothetical protein